VADAPDNAGDLELLVRLSYAVHNAVRQALTSPHRERQVAMGASGSPTAELDRIAEAQVLSALEEEGIHWNVLTEELGYIDRGGKDLLVVDPVDGSHNALSDLPFATVSLALGKEMLSDVRAGVVLDLDTAIIYWATKGGGAWLNGRRLSTRPWVPHEELFFVNLGANASSRAHALAQRARRVRSLGCASFEMSMVAMGGADGYFSDSQPTSLNLRVTDIAAAQLIVREAGGGIADSHGRPVDLPLSLEHRTSLLAWGDKRLLADGHREGYW
jgi:fructose-1,6-bisphosphatase/inositol monophosphatase family enzyme